MATQYESKFTNLTEEQFKEMYLNASNGPRGEEDNFFNKFKYKFDLFNQNPSSTLLNGIDLLKTCFSIDHEKYSLIHKGSAYYWIGMATYLLKNHELATFFFDAAVSEDIRAGHNTEDNLSPALRYMLLDGESDLQAARDLVLTNLAKIEELLKIYNSRPGSIQLSMEDLRERFLKRSLNKDNESLRSLASALISFCMDWELREMLFDLKPITGTVEPFFIHLFKGCLLFESLLKGSKVNTPPDGSMLRDAIDHLRQELGITINYSIGNTDFPSILTNLDNADESIVTAIEFTGRVRNTLGHNLGWVVAFEKDKFNRLFKMITSACFHAISCLYPEKIS